ncbi:MAG: hypothetical protein HOV81_32180 [Kofleriaceae bacterium]|nr:hypothetical protein [Kofleriaceae bacterium]
MTFCKLLTPVAALVLAVGIAHADVARVVIADSDPELQRAVVTTLAPWRFEVLVDPKAPVDIEEAKTRAAAADARFVVWRHGRDLLVFDRDRDAVEQRATSAGTLDDARAAQAALTVKTLMRLPPPPEGEGSAVPIEDGSAAIGSAAPPVVPPIEQAFEIRVQAGLGAQVDSAGAIAGGTVAALVRRWSPPVHIGIAGNLGSSTAIEQAGFKGDWRQWSVLALASYAVPAGRIEIEPFVGGGITRGVLDGTESAVVRRETATLGTARGGVWIRLPLGRFSVGGALAADFLVSTPTYIRQGGGSMSAIFEVPGFAFSIGAFAAADFSL